MFLIKRPFSGATRLEGAFNAMAKSTKKKNSAKKPAARKARPARKESVKRPVSKKVAKPTKAGKRGPSKTKKETIESPAILLGMNHREKRLDPFTRKQKENLLQLRDAMVDSMAGVAQDTLRSRAEGSEASAFGMHQADAGSDAYDRDFALSLLSQEQDALYEIDQALSALNWEPTESARCRANQSRMHGWKPSHSRASPLNANRSWKSKIRRRGFVNLLHLYSV